MKVFLVSALALLSRVNSQCISENDNVVLPPERDLRELTPFSIQLFKEVVPPSGNFFFSPYSVWTSLVLAYFGSNGETKVQMERVLRLHNRQDTLALFKKVEYFYSLHPINTNYTIDEANRIYEQDGLPLKSCLRRILPNELKALDFRPQQASQAAATINQFVSATTRGRIQQLVTANVITNAMMVLANAVYFKGLWQQQFQIENTIQEAFFESPGQQHVVPMMMQRGKFNYGVSKTLDAEVLEMPYGQGGASMLILLPQDKRTGQELHTMITRLDPSTLDEASKSLQNEEVVVKFPKFKFEKQINSELQKSLVNMGIEDLFSGKADLTNFDPNGGLRVTNILHKALIEVDEKGAEAAAATAATVGMNAVLMPKEPFRFICNRPFVFMIRDHEINNLLFVGVYRQP